MQLINVLKLFRRALVNISILFLLSTKISANDITFLYGFSESLDVFTIISYQDQFGNVLSNLYRTQDNQYIDQIQIIYLDSCRVVFEMMSVATVGIVLTLFR